MLSPEILAIASALALTIAGLVWAATSDFRRYLIPNTACGLVVAGYVVTGLAMSPASWFAGLATGGAFLAIGFVLFARGWIGGGDVKLAAAAALWAGPERLSDFAFVVAISGLGLSGLMLSPMRRAMPAAPEGPATGLRQPMPFGIPIAAGGLWVALLHLRAMS